MPFDNATKLREPNVTVLPPIPPERGGGPRRVHVVIEIVDQRRPSFTPVNTRLIGWLIVLLLLASLAHAQQTYEHWQDTNGTHGEIRREGDATTWTTYDRDGHQHTCHRYFVGDQPQTSCN
jgi:hypothetical protein